MVTVAFKSSCRGVLAACLCLLSTGPGLADPLACPDSSVTALAPSPAAREALCTRVTTALATLNACNVPLSHPVTVEIKPDLGERCLGIYHCGEERIELLPPDAMATVRAPHSSLAFVDNEDLFQSILTHELAHAAYSKAPCPFAACPSTSEYVAHVLQVMSLPAPDRKQFEATLDLQEPVSRDVLNLFVYFMAPDAFLRRAWAYSLQRPDACAYIGQIMQGRVVHDQEHFE